MLSWSRTSQIAKMRLLCTARKRSTAQRNASLSYSHTTLFNVIPCKIAHPANTGFISVSTTKRASLSVSEWVKEIASSTEADDRARRVRARSLVVPWRFLPDRDALGDPGPENTETPSFPHKPRLRVEVVLEEPRQLLHDFLLPGCVRMKSIPGVIRALPRQAVLSRGRSIRPKVGTPEQHGGHHPPLLRIVVQSGSARHLFLNRPANGKGALVGERLRIDQPHAVDRVPAICAAGEIRDFQVRELPFRELQACHEIGSELFGVIQASLLRLREWLGVLDPCDLDLLRRDVRPLELIQGSGPRPAVPGPVRGARGPAAVHEDEVSRFGRVPVHLLLETEKLRPRVRHAQANEYDLAVPGGFPLGVQRSDLVQGGPGRLLMGCRWLVSAVPIETARFSKVLVSGRHFGQRLVPDRFLLLALFEELPDRAAIDRLLPFPRGGTRRISRGLAFCLEILEHPVEVFLLLGGEPVTPFGLLVQFLDAVAVDRVLTLREAADGPNEDQQAACDGDDPQTSLFCPHRSTSLSRRGNAPLRRNAARPAEGIHASRGGMVT